jgi:hypothetical protein
MSISQLQTLNVGPGLVGVRPVGGNVPSIITPFEFEGLQSASFDIDQKIAEALGQFKMAFDSAPVEMSIKGTIETLVLSGSIFANIISGDSPTLGGNDFAYRETYTLASTVITALSAIAFTKGQIVSDGTRIGVCTVAGTPAAFTLPSTLGGILTSGGASFVTVCLDTGAPTNACAEIVSNATVFAEDGNVMYTVTNNQLGTLGGAQGLTPLPGPPAAGQYISAGTSGVYLFNAADGGQSVAISYQFTPASANNSIFPIQNHWVGWGPYCELNLQFPYQSSQDGNGHATIVAALHLVAVRFGNMKTKTKRDGYTTVTYDWQAFCPPSNIAGQFYLPN